MGRKKETIDPQIGIRIKEVRKKNNLTQAQFASMFYVTEQTVRNWESGRRKVDLEMIRNICDTLKCDISYILGIDTLIEETIDTDIDNLLNSSQTFISYLESIGVAIDVQPVSATPGINIQGNSVTPKVFYRYEVTANNEPRIFNEKEWSELQTRISEMIKLLIN